MLAYLFNLAYKTMAMVVVAVFAAMLVIAAAMGTARGQEIEVAQVVAFCKPGSEPIIVPALKSGDVVQYNRVMHDQAVKCYDVRLYDDPAPIPVVITRRGEPIKMTNRDGCFRLVYFKDMADEPGFTWELYGCVEA